MTASPVLSLADLEAFTIVAATILPAIDGDSPAWSNPIEAAEISNRLPLLFSQLPHDAMRADLKRLLGLLRSPAGGVALYRRPRAFTLSPREIAPRPTETWSPALSDWCGEGLELSRPWQPSCG